MAIERNLYLLLSKVSEIAQSPQGMAGFQCPQEDHRRL